MTLPPSPPTRDPRLLVAVALGVLWLLTAAGVVVVAAWTGIDFFFTPRVVEEPQATQEVAMVEEATAFPTSTPTRVPTPIPRCVETLLEIGEAQVVVEFLPRAADGSFQVPEGNPGVAYWLEGSTPRYAFALSPAPENQALLAQFQVGQEANIRWGDCSREEYVVTDIQPGGPDESQLTGQGEGVFIVFMQDAPGAAGFMVVAGYPSRPQEPTSEPLEGEVQVDIYFLGDEVSADGSALILQIEIENAGAAKITLTTDEISITPEGGQPMSPLSVDPALPVEIAPGAIQAFTITFPHPGDGAAVVRILDVSFDYY